MNKKILLLIISFTLVLSGCNIVFDLNSFVMPDDREFMETIKQLDTPKKICQYMKDHFTYKAHRYSAPSPYKLWNSKKGDCNDFSTFAVFVADYHGYETYQIAIFFEEPVSHMLGVFKEKGKYNYSSNQYYLAIYADTFQEIVDWHNRGCSDKYHFSYYEVYDYEMNVIEEIKDGQN